MKKTLLTVFAIIFALALQAQTDIYERTIADILANSLEIKAAESECDASLAESATGLTPADPEVEGAYLWGNSITGPRKDISVTQSFDFPTAYAKRRCLAAGNDRSARKLLEAQRQSLKLRAKELLIEMAYWNVLDSLSARQLELARETSAACRRLDSIGEATAIDLNRAMLNLADFENEAAVIAAGRSKTEAALTALNGGKPVIFTSTAFPSSSLPGDFESWLADAEKANPGLSYIESVSEAKRSAIGLAKSEGLPKFSVGYMGEFVRESDFQGIKLGISLPLWENRGKVREARAKAAAANEALADARNDWRISTRALWEEAKALDAVERRYRNALSASAHAPLMTTALAKGAVTLPAFVTEMQYIWQMEVKMLATARDKHLAIARMMDSVGF